MCWFSAEYATRVEEAKADSALESRERITMPIG